MTHERSSRNFSPNWIHSIARLINIHVINSSIFTRPTTDITDITTKMA